MSIRIYGNGKIQQSDGDEAVFQTGAATSDDLLVYDGSDWVPGEGLKADDLEEGVRYQEGDWSPVFESTTVSGGVLSGSPFTDKTWSRVGSLVTLNYTFTVGASTPGNINVNDTWVFSGVPYPVRNFGQCISQAWTTGEWDAGNRWFMNAFVYDNAGVDNIKWGGSFEGSATTVRANKTWRCTIQYTTDDTTFVPNNSANATTDQQGNVVYVGGSSGGGSTGTPGVRYQEGDWSPTVVSTVNFGSEISSSDCLWSRNGDVVTIWHRVGMDASGYSGIGDEVVLSGFPYPLADDNNNSTFFSNQSAGTTTNTQFFGVCFNGSGDTRISLRPTNTNGSTSRSTQIRGQFSYITDDTTFTPFNGANLTTDIQGTGGGTGGSTGTPGVRHQQGTWVPKLRGSGSAGTFTYSVQEGEWSRTGNVVSFWGRIGIDSASGATNTTWIQGIPYEVDDDTASIVGEIVSTKGISNVGYLIRGLTSGFYAYKQTTTGFSSIGISNMTAGTSIRFSGSYITNNTSFDPTDTVSGSLSTVTEDTQGTGGGGDINNITYAGADAWGRSNGAGTLANGFNATTSKLATGNYQVTFDTPMPNADYSVQVSANTNGNAYVDAIYSNIEATGFVVWTVNTNTASALDSDFSFVVFASNTITPPSGVGADAWARTALDGTIKSGYNFASVSLANTNKFTYTFTTPMPTADYAVTALCVTGGNAVLESQTTTGFVLNTFLSGSPNALGHSVLVHSSSSVTPTYTWRRSGTTVNLANDGDDVDLGTGDLSAAAGRFTDNVITFSSDNIFDARCSGTGTTSALFVGREGFTDIDTAGPNANTSIVISADGTTYIGGDIGSSNPNITLNANGTVDFYNRNTGNDYMFRMFSNVGGTKVEQFKFETGGNAYKPGGGAWASLSDSRSKNSITPYTSGLTELTQLETVRYKYNGSEREYVGLVAQQVETVMPEIVSVSPGKTYDGQEIEDLRTVDQTPLTFALINAVKELSAKVEALEAEVQELKSQSPDA